MDTGLSVINVSLYAPVLVHPVQHAFVGFGPFFGRDLSRTVAGGGDANAATSFGADLAVGGWL